MEPDHRLCQVLENSVKNKLILIQWPSNVFTMIFFRFFSSPDTSEAPSLASHVRRVRVPSNVDQFSDVDQYLDDLFSPVLDGSLDELSDARSLSTSIRGGRSDFFEAPEIDTSFDDLQSANKLERVIKGGGHKNDNKENEAKQHDKEVEDLNSTEISLDEYITGENHQTDFNAF